MENEKNLTNINEKSINKQDFSKEYEYLNKLKWYINFDLYKSPISCESNFYESLAWYIEKQKKLDISSREVKVSDFINSIINYKGTEQEKLLYIDKFLKTKKQEWFKENNMDWEAQWYDYLLQNIDKEYNTLDENWKINVYINWIGNSEIPERYYWRFTESWLEAKVMNKNRENFVAAMKRWMEKAEELKKQL